MKILNGTALEMLRTLPDSSVQCCVTSPPYWGLRDYGTGKWEGGSAHEYIFLFSKAPKYFFDGEAIKEDSVDIEKSRGRYLYAFGGKKMEARRKQKMNNAIGVRDFSGKRNCRSVWSIVTRPFKGAHFAVFPPELPETCIKAGTSEAGACAICGTPLRRITETIKTTGWEKSCDCESPDVVPCVVLDPFAGSGTTIGVALRLGRDAVGIELNPKYIAEVIPQRIRQLFPSWGEANLFSQNE